MKSLATRRFESLTLQRRVTVDDVGGTVLHGTPLVVRGTVTNTSDSEWPLVLADGAELRVGAELYAGSGRRKIAAGRYSVARPVVRPGESFTFHITLPTLQATAGTAELVVDLLYERVSWFHRKQGSACRMSFTITPSLSFPEIDPNVPLESPAFWQQHVPEYSASTEIGIRTPAFQEYIVPTSSGDTFAKSMLTIDELAVLYAVARYHYRGCGKIVDLGPLLGIGTNAMARGLAMNPRSHAKRKAIYSYDLFLLSDMTHFLPASDGGETGSVFARFLEINRDYLDIIEPVPGDFLKMSWTGDPIEILFIDLAKSWALNAKVLRTFFGHLIPGHSIVIQQDYVHVREPWVALTMELLDEYFERLYLVFGATAVFRLKKPLPADLLATDIAALPLEETDRLFERARSKAPATVAEVLKCSQAAVRIQKGDLDGAEALLAQVDPGVRDNAVPAQEFSRAIPASLTVVRTWLEHARQGRAS